MGALHLGAEQIESYSRRSMTPGDLLEADGHLATCAICREEIAKSYCDRATVDSLQASLQDESVQESMRLTQADTAGHVDRTLDEMQSEIVASHIALCPECRKDVLDLEAFRDALAAESPGRSPAAWQKMRSWIVSTFTNPVHVVPPRRAAGVAAAALLLWAGSLIFQRDAALEAKLPKIKGAPEHVRSDDAAGTKAPEYLAPLSEPSSTQPGASPAVLALNDSSGRVALDREGNITGLGTLSREHQEILISALSGKRLSIPDGVAGISPKRGALLSESDETAPFALVSPVGTAVLADRPKFRWQPLGGAAEYEVALYDGDFNRVAVSPRLQITEWSPHHPLSRGRTCIWRVKAIQNGEEIGAPKPPVPEARLQVISQEAAVKSDRLIRSYSNSHLMRGVFCAREGALEQAERELQALAVLNPQSAIVKRLLQDIRNARML